MDSDEEEDQDRWLAHISDIIRHGTPLCFLNIGLAHRITVPLENPQSRLVMLLFLLPKC